MAKGSDKKKSSSGSGGGSSSSSTVSGTGAATNEYSTGYGEHDPSAGQLDERVEQLLLGKGIPRDARLVALILKSMGVDNFEPAVVLQLLEFMYRYTTDVLEDAEAYATHANKDAIGMDDIRLAIQSQVNSSFTQPPPRELVMELAQQKNSLPLPSIPNRLGVLLPSEEDCLTSVNYHVDPQGDCAGARTSGMILMGSSRPHLSGNGSPLPGAMSPAPAGSSPAPGGKGSRMDVE
eukprot:TRINITY_DN25502_c0_g1_i1.p1 TRINITY_DN25502_c0_g1~~TRINITY_DN25502_c0_g1_i1.p1  ORF type:complete len:235 (-),score=38.34 TRINITY_DN25502_c0_g1_i1:149-853(-)